VHLFRVPCVCFSSFEASEQQSCPPRGPWRTSWSLKHKPSVQRAGAPCASLHAPTAASPIHHTQSWTPRWLKRLDNNSEAEKNCRQNSPPRGDDGGSIRATESRPLGHWTGETRSWKRLEQLISLFRARLHTRSHTSQVNKQFPFGRPLVCWLSSLSPPLCALQTPLCLILYCKHMTLSKAY